MTHSEGLPIPDYDHLLLSDIEHRLKGLDAGSVDRLLEHERAHAARPAAIVLLEQRRIDAEIDIIGYAVRGVIGHDKNAAEARGAENLVGFSSHHSP